MAPVVEIVQKDSQGQGWEEPYYINMGPQHPATHGVLRLFLELEGETIASCHPDIGYLHRGIEKLAEHRTYAQAMVLTDRLDYISSAANNIGYCLAVEKLFGLEVPYRAQVLRTLACEMARIASHLLWLGTHALDIGAMTVFLYCFRDRERILRAFEKLCGARLTVSYPRIGGVRQDITPEIMEDLRRFVEDFPQAITEYETLIDVNRIWLKRTKGVGVISAEEAVNLGLTGPSLRGSGVAYDVRRHRPYLIYEELEFEIPVGSAGDVYDRYRVRMQELRQSTRIISQCLDRLEQTKGEPTVAPGAPDLVMPFKKRQAAVRFVPKRHIIVRAEEGPVFPKGEVYVAIEGSKGELGYYLISDGTGQPWRLRIRAPSFVHISALPSLAEGQMVADIIAIIGSVDIVLGECDR